jgi:hypothetical protein
VLLGTTYTTLQDAIDGATEGDVIAVRGGSYRESLRFDRSLTIKAIGSQDVELAPPANWNGLVVYGEHRIIIQGFTVSLEGSSTLAVSDCASITVVDCVVRGGGDAALGDLGTRAQLRLIGSSISGLGPLAVGASGASAQLACA